jgi:hypothetical protein
MRHFPPAKEILLNGLRRGPAEWSIIDSQNAAIIEGQRSRPL